jgi:hypothetical protein
MKRKEREEENKRKGKKNFMARVTKTISISSPYFLSKILLTFMEAAVLALARYLLINLSSCRQVYPLENQNVCRVNESNITPFFKTSDTLLKWYKYNGQRP